MNSRKTHYYLSRKSGLTWLIALLLASSAMTHIIIAVMKGFGNPLFLWSQIILPVTAAMMFVYITLINGEERFYRTAIPIWMLAACFAISVFSSDFSKLVIAVCWITLLIVGIFYTAIIAGKMRKPIYLVPLIAALTAISYVRHTALQAADLATAIAAIPDLLFLLGLLTLVFAIRVHPKEESYPSWGDRVDGRRIKSIDPMSQMIPYIMVERNTAVNTFEDAFELSDTEAYIHKKREEGLTSFGITHVLLASYVRCIARFPALNRFIAGQRIYSRGEDIQFCMVVKKEMSIDSPETVIKLHLSPHDTADDVYRKMNEEVQKVKNSPLDSSFDNTALAFTMIPGVLLKFTVWILKCLDYFGLLPKSVLEISPFHGSVFFTSMGSLGIPPVYHHLYDFGNLPIFISFGCKRKATELLRNGTPVTRLYVDCKFSLDERITDGFYFASFFKYFKRTFTHPEVLDEPPKEVKQDIE